jgi:uncharacterized protein (UPF0147 family)
MGYNRHLYIPNPEFKFRRQEAEIPKIPQFPPITLAFPTVIESFQVPKFPSFPQFPPITLASKFERIKASDKIATPCAALAVYNSDASLTSKKYQQNNCSDKIATSAVKINFVRSTNRIKSTEVDPPAKSIKWAKETDDGAQLKNDSSSGEESTPISDEENFPIRLYIPNLEFKFERQEEPKFSPITLASKFDTANPDASLTSSLILTELPTYSKLLSRSFQSRISPSQVLKSETLVLQDEETSSTTTHISELSLRTVPPSFILTPSEAPSMPASPATDQDDSQPAVLNGPDGSLIINPNRILRMWPLLLLPAAAGEAVYLAKKSDKKRDDYDDQAPPKKGHFARFLGFLGDVGDILIGRGLAFMPLGNNNGACYNFWMPIRVHGNEDVIVGRRQRFTDVRPIVVVRDQTQPLRRRIRAGQTILNNAAFTPADRQIAANNLIEIIDNLTPADIVPALQAIIAARDLTPDVRGNAARAIIAARDLTPDVRFRAARAIIAARDLTPDVRGNALLEIITDLDFPNDVRGNAARAILNARDLTPAVRGNALLEIITDLNLTPDVRGRAVERLREIITDSDFPDDVRGRAARAILNARDLTPAVRGRAARAIIYACDLTPAVRGPALQAIIAATDLPDNVKEEADRLLQKINDAKERATPDDSANEE